MKPPTSVKENTYKRVRKEIIDIQALRYISANEQDNFYQMETFCRNCGEAGNFYFHKGLSHYRHRCPKCDCLYLNSRYGVTRFR